jgi:hypothetical protein
MEKGTQTQLVQFQGCQPNGFTEEESQGLYSLAVRKNALVQLGNNTHENLI